MWINFGVMLVAFVIILVIARPSFSRARPVRFAPVDLPDAFKPRSMEALVDVSALTIAFDSRARRHIQQQLESLALGGYRSDGSAQTPAELAKLLRHTANTLKAHKIAWLYAGGRDVPPAAEAVARARFTEMVADLRSRYRHEVLSNIDGNVERRDAPEAMPRAHEGWGVVVVSLVVAARGDLLALHSGADAHSVEMHLERLGNVGLELQAFEVIWSPSVEEDRMSTLELEVLYPELVVLDEVSILGRTFCLHCAAPYAAELESCPSCGAPRSAV